MNNPNDIPGRIELVFQEKEICEHALQSMTYQLKFNQFKIEGRCIKNETKR
jgi:hypothetical protein